MAANLFFPEVEEDEEHVDMLDGGENTIAIALKHFYKLWQSSQKENLKVEKLEIYKLRINRGDPITAPILENIFFDADGTISIRTADGRHRIAAAKKCKLETIHIRASDALINEISFIFPELIKKEAPAIAADVLTVSS